MKENFSKHIANLIVKHLRDILEKDEKNELDAWLNKDPKNRQLFDNFHDSTYIFKQLALIDELKDEGELRHQTIPKGKK